MSSILENPGIEWTDSFVFFKYFLAVVIASLSEIIDFPIESEEAPKPLPCPTSTILILIWIPFVILGLFYKLKFKQNIEYLDYRNISEIEVQSWACDYIIPLFLVYLFE